MPIIAVQEKRFVEKLTSFLAERVVPGLERGYTVEVPVDGNLFDQLSVGPHYAPTYEAVRRRVGEHARRILFEEFGLRSYPRLEFRKIVFPPTDEGAPPLQQA